MMQESESVEWLVWDTVIFSFSNTFLVEPMKTHKEKNVQEHKVPCI